MIAQKKEELPILCQKETREKKKRGRNLLPERGEKKKETNSMPKKSDMVSYFRVILREAASPPGQRKQEKMRCSRRDITIEKSREQRCKERISNTFCSLMFSDVGFKHIREETVSHSRKQEGSKGEGSSRECHATERKRPVQKGYRLEHLGRPRKRPSYSSKEREKGLRRYPSSPSHVCEDSSKPRGFKGESKKGDSKISIVACKP